MMLVVLTTLETSSACFLLKLTGNVAARATKIVFESIGTYLSVLQYLVFVVQCLF